MRPAILVTLLCFFPIVLFAEIIRPGSLEARSDGSAVVLRWITDEEPNVTRFEIERRVGASGGFDYIAELSAKGPSLYEFIDHSAYRATSTLYQYRIKIVFSDNSSIYSSIVTVTHTVSGVRKTWGSIKAMFR